jgi:hypothetical protein
MRGARRGTTKGEALDGFNRSRNEKNGGGGGWQVRCGGERWGPGVAFSGGSDPGTPAMSERAWLLKTEKVGR